MWPSRHAPARARELVARACAGPGQAEIRSVAQVVITELVTNAVVHARTEIQVSISVRGAFLHMVVADHDHRPAIRQPGPGSGAGGRGLGIVEALSASWGSVSTADGKMVWAMLPMNA